MLADAVRRLAMAVCAFVALTVPDPGAGAHRNASAFAHASADPLAAVVLTLLGVVVLTVWFRSGQRVRPASAA